MKNKRYVAVVEFYIEAPTDSEAIYTAENFCLTEKIKHDNGCSLLKLVEQPFGKIGNREVNIEQNGHNIY